MTAVDILLDMVVRPMSELRSGQTGQALTRDEIKDEARTLIDRIRYGETERCAALLEHEADKFQKCKGLHESNLLRSCAEQLLGTSPGKGDG